MAARGSNANGTARPVQVPAAARGRAGRGRGGGSRTPSEAGDGSGGPRFERISLAELEAQQYADGDGADSVLNSDEEAEADEFSRVRNVPDPRGGSRRRKRSRGGPRKEGPGAHDEDESGDESESGDDSDGGERRRKLEGMLGAAAFGGTGGAWKQAGSDAGSVPSEQSSARRRDAYRDAFPVRGVNCVGCALNNRIGPVNRFVRDNISQMTEDALWKMAALTYKRDVAELAEREGAVVPKWGWKEVRVHYELHSTSNLVARHKMLRQLQSMRSQQEQRLVRVDAGEKELDRQGADMMLKVRAIPALCPVCACVSTDSLSPPPFAQIMQAESRERQLLEQSVNGKKRD
jgi:hypothetical protein